MGCPHAARAQGSADQAATAQGLYDSASDLMKAGRFAEACPKLEESERLDPAMGTRFFLALCYESTGRPTRAWSLYLEVAAAAKAAGDAVRASTARSRAEALEPRLPRITVSVPQAIAALPGISVRRDDTPLAPVVWGSPVPVDFGEHRVSASAPGKAPWHVTVSVRELGQRVEVQVPPLPDAAGPRGQPSGAALAAPPPREIPGRRVAALVVGSLGVAGLITGGALGLVARSEWSRATQSCPAQVACSPDAHDQGARAASLATGSTIAFAAGGAALVGGIVLGLVAPSARATARLMVLPVGARAAGAFVTGEF